MCHLSVFVKVELLWWYLLVVHELLNTALPCAEAVQHATALFLFGLVNGLCLHARIVLGKCLVIGSKCNPLYMQPEYSNTKEASNRKFVWKQDMPDKFVIGTYAGALPALADAPSSEAGA